MLQSLKNQRRTALIQSCFSLKQRCSALKQGWVFQFWTALIQRKSELISSETELISADVYHVLWISAEKRQNYETALFSADVYHFLWISAEKRQNYETALFSADYLWDFNPGNNITNENEKTVSKNTLKKYFSIFSKTNKKLYEFKQLTELQIYYSVPRKCFSKKPEITK